MFDATRRDAMGRRWQLPAADVDALCERPLAVGVARGRREAVDALRGGATLEQSADGLTGPR